MNEPIRVRLSLPAPVDQVWRAWTKNEQLTTWLTAKANVKPVVGGPYELFWEPEHPDLNSTLGCKLTAVESKRLLAFSWRGPSQFADLMNAQPFPTSVRVTFTKDEPGQTVVEFEHRGWGQGPRWAKARAWQERAWRGAFDQLQAKFKPAAAK